MKSIFCFLFMTCALLSVQAQSVTISTTTNCFNPAVVVPYAMDLNGKPAYNTSAGNIGGVSNVQLSVLWANNRWEILVGGGTVAYINNNNTANPPETGWQAFAPSFPLGTCGAGDPAPNLSGDTEALPVDLINFSGVQNDSWINLDWKTASEINNKGFEIQKSEDGMVWNRLGFTIGKGTSHQLNQYGYTDKKPHSNMNYYRLIQLDLDGKINVSGTILVDFDSDQRSYRISPNPFKDIIELSSNRKLKEKINVQILDGQGKSLQAWIIDENESIDLSSLDRGIYFLRIVSLDNYEIHKIIKN